ncbi:nuclear transport factor 2 family protein [Deinococcus yavapaiensis]|uniref:Putative SnoaL-like aldol condensation-catalyzing enzyme n=1 Tax=Deinococcus yavapaiensis KR-236 TaxID=694435 RepID=A0A318S8J5_9DEIO|nr:nuclear transport factor 2 family protein [Deinococcus yavapaiensis]PYE51952.1 putative SnoaL-like aldol condensation-catalyzing enzyme [Deinococcus yavapaiensis KR-236]
MKRPVSSLALVAFLLAACAPRAAMPALSFASGGSMNTTTPATTVLSLIRDGLEKNDAAVVRRLVAPEYRQHNPMAEDGRAGLLGLLRTLPEPMTYDVRRVLQDGELVVVHSRLKLAGADFAAFDLFRVRGEQVVEHWDVLQPWQERTVSGRSQVDGPTEVTDLGRTEANRALVRDFLNEVLIGGQGSRVTDFISTQSYWQHNPNVGDGLAGFGAAMEGMAKAGVTMTYTRIHRLVAEGNFVFSLSEGQFGGQHVAFGDLFRLQDGKIVEHWDAIQEVPASSRNANGVF